QIYKTSVKSGETSKWAQVEIPIDPEPYKVEQVWYKSKDGTKVSMFIVRRKDAPNDGSTPFLLYGYGGFQVNMKPYFSSGLYPWLEAGGGYYTEILSRAVGASGSVIMQNPSAFDGWTRSHGDNSSTKFSNLAQINRANVAELELAWSFDSARHADGTPAPWQYPVQANPVVAEGMLYTATPDDSIVALDAATGKLRWEYRAPGRPAPRGMAWWAGDETTPPRLYFSAGKALIALDARTGRPEPSFGDAGVVPLRRSTAAPAIVGDQLLVTTNKPAALSAFSLRTGEPRWQTQLLRFSDQSTGCSPWGGFSVDDRRGLAFVTTGNPRPAMYGIGRPGNNPHCNSVVAIDTSDGEIVWAFQEVAHLAVVTVGVFQPVWSSMWYLLNSSGAALPIVGGFGLGNAGSTPALADSILFAANGGTEEASALLVGAAVLSTIAASVVVQGQPGKNRFASYRAFAPLGVFTLIAL
ncbi:MAG: PQQ-binding-like beta-propeller repeat protein, partial [Candidatus Poseidoniia archaeon]